MPTKDPLTGVYSRVYLEKRLGEEVERAQRYQESITLLLVDLDHFKDVNDAFGRIFGDEILVEFAEHLCTLVRSSDLIFRYRGDEFVILLPHTAKEESLFFAQRLLTGIQTFPLRGEPLISLSLSIGVASFPEDGSTPEALFEKATLRLQAAKRWGRGRIVQEDPAQQVLPPFEDPPHLVERDEAVGTLDRFFEGLVEERRGIIAVTGPAGVGKSRFLFEVGRAAQMRDYLSISLQGTLAMQSRPFGAFIKGWAGWAGSRPASIQREEIVPILQRFLQKRGKKGVIFIVDDLPSVDQMTLNLLGQLFSSEIVVFGLAYSADQVVSRRVFPLETSLHEIITLRPLSQKGLRIWLRSLLQRDLPDEFLEWLYRETKGLPSAVREGLSYLVGRGMMTWGEYGWTLKEDISSIRLSERVDVPSEMPPHNLPVTFTGFVGRDDEIQAVKRLLSEKRLVSIVGPGGIGKTRLAIQSAAEVIESFPHGVYFVPLASLSSPDFLVSTIADVVNIAFYGREDPKLQLVNYLRGKEMLLVMDSFEHLVEGSTLLTEVLTNAPGVRILVTSRERLNLQGESILEIQGLTFPAEGQSEGIEECSAVQLFLQNARRVYPEFFLSKEELPFAARICQLVEGLPLGVELAAAWVRVLSCRSIAQEIEHNLDFLTTSLRDTPERHRSLRAVFEHSWNLLSEEQRKSFCKLALFRGGFRREAAEQVAGTSLALLSALVDKSFLGRRASGRYEMLEIVRQYAEEKLTRVPQEKEAVQALHGRYYATFLHQAEELLKGKKQREALRAIAEEIENVRTAWAWMVERRREEEIEDSLESLFLFYEIQSWFQEGEDAFGRVVEALGGRGRKESELEGRRGKILAKALARQGGLCHHLGMYREARELLQESLSIFRYFDMRAEMALPLTHLGFVSYLQGAYGEAKQLCQESLVICQETDNRWRMANTLVTLGLVAFGQGEYAEAERCFRENMAICREIGDRWGLAFSLNNLGYVAYLLGEYAEAKELCQGGLSILKEIGHQYGVAATLDSLGNIASAMGEYQEAKGYFFEALKTAMDTRAVPLALELFTGIATVLEKEGRVRQAYDLICFARYHPASDKHTQDRAARLLAELEAHAPQAAIAGVKGVSSYRTLEEVVESLLAPRHRR